MKPPAFQFYPDDFLGGTMTMNHEERGFYILLLCLQWTQCGISPDDFDRLGRGMAQPSVDHVKSKFDLGSDGMLRQHRLEKVRAEQSQYRANRSESGKAGAEARWHSHSTAIAQPMASGMAKNSSPSPSPNNTPLPPNGFSKAWEPNPEQKRLNAIFRRRDNTPWSKQELAAWKAVTPVADENMTALERYYKAAIPAAQNYRRRDLCTLLNNFNGEVDRARGFKAPTCI